MKFFLQGNSCKYVTHGRSKRSESGLTLFSVDVSDAGEYRLHVWNIVWPEVEKFITVTFTIKIREPPDMVTNLAKYELQTGDNITLQCTALNPIIWTYPRQRLDRSTHGAIRQKTYNELQGEPRTKAWVREIFGEYLTVNVRM